MAIALLKNSTIALRKEVTYGVDPGTITKADVIEASGVPTFNETYATITRDVINKSFSTPADIRGLGTTSGDIAVELHGSGVAGTEPESNVLYEAAMGYKITGGTATASSATSAAYATDYFAITITVDDTSSFVVGRAVTAVDNSAFVGEGFVNEVTDGTTLVIESKTDWSTSVTATTTISEGVVYSLLPSTGSVGDLPSFTADFWRGDITRENYLGNIVTGMTLDMSAGALTQPKFTFEGSEVNYTASDFDTDVPTGTLSYDSAIANPLIARSVDLIITDGTTVNTMPVASLKLDLANTVQKLESIDTAGIFQVIRTKRAVTGSLNTFYESVDFQTAFKNETHYELRGIIGDTLGNKFAISAPRLKFSAIPVKDNNGVFEYDATFALEATGAGDNELIIQFL